MLKAISSYNTLRQYKVHQHDSQKKAHSSFLPFANSISSDHTACDLFQRPPPGWTTPYHTNTNTNTPQKMQAVKTQTMPRKSSMMERLRRLHAGLKPSDSSTNTPHNSATTKSNSRSPLSFIFTVHTTTTKSGAIVVDQAHRQPHRASTTSKSRSRHREYALDLEQLDSKLEKLALSDRDSEEHADEDNVVVIQPRSIDMQEDGAEHDKETGTVSRHTASDIEIIVHPPFEEAAANNNNNNNDGTYEAEVPQPHVSDFDIFLQQAAEDERRRAESTPKSSRKELPHHHQQQQQQQQQPLNQFYSNNWAGASSSSPSSKPKLAEIHEDEGSAAETKQETTPAKEAPASEKKQPHEQSASSRGLAILSSTTTRSISPDQADSPGRRPVHTQTWPGGPMARHVSFQEPMKTMRGRTRSNPNLYHAARCAESPEGRRAFARRKSIRRAITDYMRQLA
ncbi:hypothetical protein BD289DRAFT_160495 [Coniella lustricola]|uniref:Uncharacterized protein n=1 Tax=Coniella lustricola TaxID=2025994 RepID=A0A2T2ZUL3_9PEZI|nr:hypothetical protein BD289DRAFT_160495 [Coniella lustricola]